MPYTSFAKMTDEDVRALYAYMMHGVEAVNSRPPPTKVSFPFNQRWVLALWNLAFAPDEPFRARNDRDAQWNRGAYLVQSLGHCGACHTPRGVAFEERAYDESSVNYLSGAVNDNWFALNLRPDSGSGSGIGRLTANDIAKFLRTGHGAGIAAFGSMVQTVEDSLQYLSDDDLASIARYLKSLPPDSASDGQYRAPSKTAPNLLAPNPPPATGAAVYATFCAQCHQPNGTGVPQVFPKLAGNPAVISEDTTSLIRLLVEGGSSPTTTQGPPRESMPGFTEVLSDVQIAQVLTYIRASWGNDARSVTTSNVASLRSELHK
jgi:mono/diheme cytochrome c family protein